MSKVKDTGYGLNLNVLWGKSLSLVGIPEPKGSRTDFGALLVGYYNNGTLRYAGKVGTGFSDEVLIMLGEN